MIRPEGSQQQPQVWLLLPAGAKSAFSLTAVRLPPVGTAAAQAQAPSHVQHLCQTEAGAAELAGAMEQLLQAAGTRLRQQWQQAEDVEAARQAGRQQGREEATQKAAAVSASPGHTPSLC